MNNKRGEERIFSIWWFVVIVVISGVIVLATLGFFSKESNTKDYESKILYDKILECLVENGHLREDFNKDFDIFSSCNLDEQVIEKTGNFYLEIKLANELILEKGDKSKNVACSIVKKIKSDDALGCVNLTEIVIVKEDDSYSNQKLSVLTVSNQESSSFVIGGKNE